MAQHSRSSSNFREQSLNGDRRLNMEVFNDNHPMDGGSFSKQNELYCDPDPQEYEKISVKQVSIAKESADLVDADHELEADVFSMILVTKPLSLNFLYLTFCVLFQYLLLFLLLFNLLHDKPADNILSVPPGIEFEVRIAQFLAILLAAMTADDKLGAISMLYIGMNQDILDMVPGATFTSWCIAFIAKFLEGSACHFIIFILIVQSANVVTLCLNFAALSFVWAIDDVFYTLCQNGYFADSLIVLADSISDIRLPNASKRSLRTRNIAYFIMTSMYVIAWGILVEQQLSGKFLCNTLLIQFGDEYEPVTSRFSGVFKLTSSRTSIHGYMVYESNTDIAPGSTYANPVISYCSDEGAWTLSFKYYNETDYSPCRWVARSPDTGTFDVTTVPTRWSVKKELSETLNNGDLPFLKMKLECLDCETNNNPSRGSCTNGAGYCVDNRCICKEGRFGLSCEYLDPCNELHVYGGEPGFSAHPNGTLSFTNKFLLVKTPTGSIVTVKNKPVYSQEIDRTHHVLMFFNGLRWVLTSSVSFKDFKDYDEFNFEKKIAHYMHNEFHPFWSAYVGYFMSESMLLSSPSDRVTPSLLPWYSASPSSSLLYPHQGAVDELLSHIPTLACGGCSSDHLCRHGASCKDGICICLNNCTFGDYCEDVDPDCSLLQIWGHDKK